MISRKVPYHRDPPRRLKFQQPRIGGKYYSVTEKGMWVLEEGPGMLQMWLCTAAGSGGVFIYDGVPNDEGLFEPIGDVPGREEGLKIANATGRHDYNGRLIYSATPPIMQPWAMNAGFSHGLTLEITGNDPRMPSEGARTVGTCVWQAFGARTAEKKRP